MAQILPHRDLGVLMGSMLHREQSFGEIRGLERLEKLLLDRKSELESKLDPIQQKPIHEDV